MSTHPRLVEFLEEWNSEPTPDVNWGTCLLTDPLLFINHVPVKEVDRRLKDGQTWEEATNPQ